ncbi:hypothetical protein [Evansella cellulosilytica]|uniref:Uncharacterized protein n=1 Tax=Evansella cellulosilytica (strain ATCC 21833 / DSM 2522 / FERM P-1141 / JCM 9156 / N-4) TaxID=649639 RepID=E6U075_EVAC2|nr:hypothetical protein [Evansella cellulosilytica]ADU30191.1 hypothetical protein Bcell_1929 [Evansella cellulosilytica DSM 2522]
MKRDELVERLKELHMTEIIELIEDAENGDLEELELARALGLLRDEKLNDEVIKLLEDKGVNIIYLEDDEE